MVEKRTCFKRLSWISHGKQCEIKKLTVLIEQYTEESKFWYQNLSFLHSYPVIWSQKKWFIDIVCENCVNRNLLCIEKLGSKPHFIFTIKFKNSIVKWSGHYVQSQSSKMTIKTVIHSDGAIWLVFPPVTPIRF